MADGLTQLLGAIITARSDGAVVNAPTLTLRDENLTDQRMHKALRGADLRASKLVGCALDDVDLTGADLAGAISQYSSFVRCRFDRSSLSGAMLHRVDLTNAVFERTHLRGCDITSSTLDGARFHECDLRGAVLWGTPPVLAPVFRACDLSGADLTGLGVTRAELDLAGCATDGTMGLATPAEWADDDESSDGNDGT